jgi:hypothetical protein
MSRKRKIDEISQDEISQGEEPNQQVAVTIDEISQGEEPNNGINKCERTKTNCVTICSTSK